MQRVLYFDGLCEPSNPGGWATWGWVAFRDGVEVASGHGSLGRWAGSTNNIAEYTAALEALRWLDKRSAGPGVILRGDSRLVISQISGEWRCNSEHLIPLCEEAKALVARLGVAVEWIPRAQNGRADELSRLAYDEARKLA